MVKYQICVKTDVFYRRLHLLGIVDFWENIGIEFFQLALPTAIQLTVQPFPCWGCHGSEPEQLMEFYCWRTPKGFVGANPHQNAWYMHNSYCALQIFALLNVNEVKGKTKSRWFKHYQKPSKSIITLARTAVKHAYPHNKQPGILNACFFPLLGKCHMYAKTLQRKPDNSPSVLQWILQKI